MLVLVVLLLALARGARLITDIQEDSPAFASTIRSYFHRSVRPTPMQVDQACCKPCKCNITRLTISKQQLLSLLTPRSEAFQDAMYACFPNGTSSVASPPHDQCLLSAETMPQRITQLGNELLQSEEALDEISQLSMVSDVLMCKGLSCCVDGAGLLSPKRRVFPLLFYSVLIARIVSTWLCYRCGLI
jgi:hypothetical protein